MTDDQIFSLNLFLFYDNKINQKRAGFSQSKDNIKMFLKTHLISFIYFRLPNDDKPLFIPAETIMYDDVLQGDRFILGLADELIASYDKGGEYENEFVCKTLRSLKKFLDNADNEDKTIKIKHHNTEKTRYKKSGHTHYTYNYVAFSEKMVRKLSRLFVSTVIYFSQKLPWPVTENKKKVIPEGLAIKFDMKTHKAEITSVSVYTPKEAAPYQFYINDVLDRIWNTIDNASEETDKSEDEPIDFYKIDDFDEDKNWGTWQPIKKLQEALDKNEPAPFGIYMLYNSEKKEFYVGKAENVYQRIDQHRKSNSISEPMHDFDYFRFTLVDPAHYRELFLIENAAIHDCAAILNMPGARTHKLDKISLAKHITDDINGVTMTNRDEAQTKWQKVKK